MRAAAAAVAAALLLLAALAPQTEALAWRLFAGREECITEFMPDYQWALVQKKKEAEAEGGEKTAENSHVLIDLGFVITSRYGTEASKASVDFTIVSPDGSAIHREEGVDETEIAVTAEGEQGPWKACFKVAKGQVLRPSVLVKVSYFTIHSMSLVGTNFEWQRDTRPGGQSGSNTVDIAELGSKEQVQEVTQGLQRLDFYLTNVTHEQRYLYARTVRHLRTAESTKRRTLLYSMLLTLTIVAASLAQVMGVRWMFQRGGRGLIM